MSLIYALDFDGVICDSCGESAISALITAKRLWPEVFQDGSWEELPNWLMEKMRSVRPVVETGYENVVLIRLLIEEERACENSTQGSRPLTVGEIQLNWNDIKDNLIEKYGRSVEDLVEAFGATRDEWMDRHLDSWLKANRFYPGVVHTINHSTSPIFVITTKQTRFAKALLDYAGVTTIPEENIFGYGSGSKVSVIKKILKMPGMEDREIQFVEDRLATLETAELSLLGAPVRYYFATWGYSTEAEKRRAASDPQIDVIDLPDFEAKFQ